jgi:NAD(P)-dependent dehydrogenase (short-subunit alcohol dehydrogenase family)
VVVLDRTGDVVVDLADTDDVRRAAELVLDRYGRCDVFVHAAATFAFGPLEQVELDTWREGFQNAGSGVDAHRLLASLLALLRDGAHARASTR